MFRVIAQALAGATMIVGLAAGAQASPLGLGQLRIDPPPAPTAPNAFINTGATTLAPMGHVVFCLRNPQDCRPTSSSPRTIWLTPERFNDLRVVNRELNRRIRPVRDTAVGPFRDIWKVATDEGDCVDTALAKRAELIRRGFPEAALRIGVGYTPSGEGHAVLVVRTSRGDFVLDNRHDRVSLWSQTDLRWVMVQSSVNPRRWHEI